MTISEDHVEAVLGRIDSMVMESLQELFHRLPFGQEVTLSNGEVARFRAFTAPKIAQYDMPGPPKGKPYCSIELRSEDGEWDLEFWIFKGGGSAGPRFIAEHQPPEEG